MQEAVAKQNKNAGEFLKHYYGLFDNKRADLSKLYTGKSMMTYNTANLAGQADIMSHITGKIKWKQVKRNYDFRSQPTFGGGFIVVVSGKIKLDGDDSVAFNFTEMFNLVKVDGKFYIHNHVFIIAQG